MGLWVVWWDKIEIKDQLSPAETETGAELGNTTLTECLKYSNWDKSGHNSAARECNFTQEIRDGEEETRFGMHAQVDGPWKIQRLGQWVQAWIDSILLMSFEKQAKCIMISR